MQPKIHWVAVQYQYISPLHCLSALLELRKFQNTNSAAQCAAAPPSVLHPVTPVHHASSPPLLALLHALRNTLFGPQRPVLPSTPCLAPNALFGPQRPVWPSTLHHHGNPAHLLHAFRAEPLLLGHDVAQPDAVTVVTSITPRGAGV